jgi:hypothetical protein
MIVDMLACKGFEIDSLKPFIICYGFLHEMTSIRKTAKTGQENDISII